MSWSRSYSGTAAEVIAQAKSQQAEIESTLPDFEKADVAHVIEAAETTLKGLPEGAKVSLSINGHASRSTNSMVSGGMGVSVTYSEARR
jgi:hypothetical protein